MALSIIGSVTGNASSGVAVTPTGAASGDWLFFFVCAYGNTSTVKAGLTSFTAPAGATLVPGGGPFGYTELNNGGGPTQVWIYQKLLSGTPASTYTFTLVADGGFGGTDVATICVRGAAAVPVDTGTGAPTNTNSAPGGSVNASAPGLTPTAANELLVWFYFGQNQSLSAAPSGMSAHVITTGGPTGSAWELCSQQLTTPTATGTKTATTTSDEWIATMFAIVPAVTVSAPPLRTQQRAPGFPPRGPLPGIPRLGTGLLVAPTVQGGIARLLAMGIQPSVTLGTTLLAQRLLTDAVLGQATLTAPALGARPLTSAIHGVASATFVDAVARGMASVIHGAAAVSDALSVARAMTEAIAGRAALTDAASVARSLALSAHGTAVLSDLLGKAFQVALAAHGQATVADALAVKRAMTEAIGAHGTLTPGQVLVARGMADALASSALLTEALKVARPLSMGLQGAAHVVAAFAPRTLVLALAIHAAADTSDVVSIARALAATLNGHASAADTLLVSRALTAALAAHASTADPLAVSRPMADAMVGEATVTAPLSRLRTLAAAVSSAATVSIASKVVRALSLAAKGQGSLLFSLDGALVTLAVAILGRASAAPASNVLRGLASTVEGQANLSAGLAFLFHLAVSIAGQATWTSPASIRRGFEVHALARAVVLEQLAVARAFGLSLDANAFLRASFDQSLPPVALHGTLVIDPEYLATLAAAAAFDGAIAIAPETSGSIAIDGIFGTLTVE